MNTYRPINTGEGEITLVPGISCASPFDKLKISDCGAITFLDGPCRICGKKEMRPISKTLEKQYYGNLNSRRLQETTFLAMEGILAVLYTILMLLLVSRGKRIGIPVALEVVMLGSAVFMIARCILQLLYWFETAREMMRTRKGKIDEKIVASYVLAYEEPPKATGRGMEGYWFMLVLDQYKNDISYLRRILQEIVSKREENRKAEEIYYEALKLSYITDCTELAELRLECLDAIGVHLNAHSDIEQILHIIPAEHFEKNPKLLYQVEKCLESYSEPLSDWSVSCIMCDLVHFMKADPDREIIKKCMAHCSGGKLMRFFKYNRSEEYKELRELFSELGRENNMIALQIEACMREVPQ